MDVPSPCIEVEGTLHTAREEDGALKKGEIDFYCDTDEIEELLNQFADEDVKEAQVESHTKLDEVKAKIRLEMELENGLQEIEDAEFRDKATLAVKLQQAIADGNDEARGALPEPEPEPEP